MDTPSKYVSVLSNFSLLLLILGQDSKHLSDILITRHALV